MYSLLDALAYLHKIGIGHSDIKPENILINDKLEIQIIDFGLSCTKKCNPSGTILFAAPEILNNIGSNKKFSLEFIQKSDVFSMGIVFYLLANLELPYPVSGKHPYQLEEEYVRYKKNDKQEVQSDIQNEHSDDDDDDDESIGSFNNSIGSFKSDNSDYSSVVTDFLEQSDNENIVNLNNDLTSIYTLSNFYKNRINTIISYYNYNQTEVDEKINVLIESMLKPSDKISKGRPSTKRLLKIVKKIIDEYNSINIKSPIIIKQAAISPTTISPITPDDL
jgi:serine/threonine protein kinase